MDEAKSLSRTHQISISRPRSKSMSESITETKSTVKPTPRPTMKTTPHSTARATERPVSRSRSGYRSAYRSSQRAVMNHKEYTKKNYKEIFMIQVVACGIILCIVLFSAVIHIPFAESLNENLTALVKEDGLSTDGELSLFEGMKNSIQGIFTGEPEEATVPAENTANTVDANAVNGEDFRIDEDILEEMNSTQDFYGESEKKTEVPKE